MGNKKTLYEVLNCTPDASFEQIQAEYKSLAQNLESAASGLSVQDAAAQLKLLNIAFQVLRDNMSRAAYDAKLNQQTSLALVPKTVDTEALTIKMEAATMKADAAALLAQAAMVNANALSLHYAATPHGIGAQASSSFFKTFRFGFTVLGAIVAVSMVVMVFSGRRGSGPAMEVKAQEKVMLQEYHQMYGVKPSSKAEMDLLDAQRRKEESERRGEEAVQRNAEREADKKDRADQRLSDETEKLGRKVEENLRRGEEQARQLAREEEYRQQQEQTKIQLDKMNREEVERTNLRDYKRNLGLK
jgi:curved DNA-binding protein CbpA